MNTEWIKTLVEKVVISQSFDFHTFEDAKNHITIASVSREKRIIYDRLTLRIYDHNFTTCEYQQFAEELKKYLCNLSHDYMKVRTEYSILLTYILLAHSDLLLFNVTKCENPDFLLSNGSYRIGVEITQLTTQYDKVLNKISSLSHSGLTANEFREKAIAKFGKKAKNYRYHEINKSAVIGTNLLYISSTRSLMPQLILSKYKRYEKNSQSFDKYIILCDSEAEYYITEESEVDEVISGLKEYKFNKPFYVAILWSDFHCKCTESLILSN